jgi:hypothetical protein
LGREDFGKIFGFNHFIPPCSAFEAISKIGFWLKVAAGLSFPALRDDPPYPIPFVGLKPEVRLRRIGI